MRYNGFVLVLGRALGQVDDALLERHRDALILGAIREDIGYVPWVDVTFEHLSLSHFYRPPLPGGFVPLLWPGARSRAERYFARAVRERRAGRVASACVQLGRAAHLLVDMACPVHVHRQTHDTDLYEWYVDTSVDELRALPLPEVPRCESAAEIIHRMASATARFPADRTQHALGRLLKRWGLLRPVPRAEVAEQARQLVPLNCAYAAELLRLFLRRSAGA